MSEATLKDARKRLENAYYLPERASGPARDGFNDRINILHAEVQRLERQVKAGMKAVEPTADVASMISKIGALIDDLGNVVNSESRDAARAKEMLRTMIDLVVVSSAPAQGKDDRGTGPVTIRIEGSITAMVDYCENRVIHRRGTNPATVDHCVFSVHVRWSPSRGDDFEADVALWSTMLDDADVPLTLAVLSDALIELDVDAPDEAFKARDRRARRLLDYFKQKSLVGCVHWSDGVGRTAGWVWSERLDTADLWRERAKAPPPSAMAVVRLTGPGAFGKVVGGDPNANAASGIGSRGCA